MYCVDCQYYQEVDFGIRVCLLHGSCPYQFFDESDIYQPAKEEKDYRQLDLFDGAESNAHK
jgi:hypothetical protein